MKNKNSGFSDKSNETERGQGKKKMPPQTKGDKYPLKNRYYEDDDDELDDFLFDESDDFSDDEDEDDY